MSRSSQPKSRSSAPTPEDRRPDGSQSSGRSSRSRKQDAPRLYNIVSIRFRTNFIRHDFDALDLQLRAGDDVVVESPRGPLIARVEGHVQRRLVTASSVPKVIRLATDDDLDQADRNEQREEGAYRFALERIRSRRLPMKLVRAQFVHDGSKIVFYFSADGRIDFRDLVKDLAHRFRTRIEMHQIGVRDGSRMLGGIGPCGRELCCSTFLENFAPVSIRMAKDQGLTLNPKKVSGMCGRLMCCLVYEQHVYKRMRRRLPRPNTPVFTEDGPGRVLSVDIINERVTVELEDTNRRVFAAREISLSEVTANLPTVDADPEHEPDYLWDDLLAGMDDDESELSIALDDEPDGEESEVEEDSEDSPTSARRRRARRRRRGSNNSTKNNAPSGEAPQRRNAEPRETDTSQRNARSRNTTRAPASQAAAADATTPPREAPAPSSQDASSSTQEQRGRSNSSRRRRGRGSRSSRSNDGASGRNAEDRGTSQSPPSSSSESDTRRRGASRARRREDRSSPSGSSASSSPQDKSE